jgi:hypothetical protein
MVLQGGHTEVVRSVQCFGAGDAGPSAPFCLTGGEDGRVCLWSLEPGKGSSGAGAAGAGALAAAAGTGGGGGGPGGAHKDAAGEASGSGAGRGPPERHSRGAQRSKGNKKRMPY